MFDSLNEKLGAVFASLRKHGTLTEQDIDAAMREVRIALLEADVALPIVKQFTASLKEQAVGQQVTRNINPAQMVIKLVQDHLEELLGSEYAELDLQATPPIAIMMVGLQGSGKTTSSGKLAHRLKKEGKKVLLASLDTQRPAAQQQLEVLAHQAGVGSLPIIAGDDPVAIARRSMKSAREEGYDIVILDTAGRLHIDDALMTELAEIRTIANPRETLLVADALTGQDAVNIAREFHERIGVTGIILTRLDGDARGGAALSMRQVTGQPIKFMGVGEKLSEFEPFYPKRIASRILDMGDVVSLVERAAASVDQAEAEAMAKKMRAGSFDFNDLLKQFQTMKKMGGLGSFMNLLPGIGKIKKQLDDVKLDDSVMARQEAIIFSMTAKERANPKLLNGGRKKRIATGSGTTVQEVNKLIKAQLQMEDMMKKMRKAGGMKGMQKMMKGMNPEFLPPELKGMLPPR